MSKYGLQLRVPPSQQKKQPTKPPLPPPQGFSLDDDDDNVETDILRQGMRNRARKEIEEQQKKAMEEDPSVFDYDGVYDEMKEKSFRRRVQDRADTAPKYIGRLMQKAEERKRNQDLIYERKLAKERNKEEHLYADKDKFVTNAYRKKLAEQKMWEEQQRLRDLRDEKDDVTKKTDLSDFYFNLSKNVAFGGEEELRNLAKKAEPRKPEKEEEERAADKHEKEHLSTNTNPAFESFPVKEGHLAENSTLGSIESSHSNPSFDRPVSDNLVEEKTTVVKPSANNLVEEKTTVVKPSADEEKSEVEKPPADQPKPDHHKRSADALEAAKARFLARKRAKEE